jgi:hypothetical protein
VLELPTAAAGNRPAAIATANVRLSARRFNIRTPFSVGSGREAIRGVDAQASAEADGVHAARRSATADLERAVRTRVGAGATVHLPVPVSMVRPLVIV